MKIDAGHDGVKSPVAATVRRYAMSALGQMLVRRETGKECRETGKE
jgi:hypothetical protein